MNASTVISTSASSAAPDLTEALGLTSIGAEWLGRVGAALVAAGLVASELSHELRTGHRRRPPTASAAAPPGRTSIRLSRRSARRAA
jgi:hypothetical protein